MKRLFLYILPFLILEGCTKKEEGNCKDGYIQWEGDPAADGLGWVFREGDAGSPTLLKLKDLPESYQEDNLQVRVCLLATDEKFNCHCAVPLPVYKVVRIRKR